MGTAIRVLCVDDHRLMREGIARIVGVQPDMTVVAQASDGEQAVAQFLRYRPGRHAHGSRDADDGRRAGDPGDPRSPAPDARIVVLTMYHGDEDIHRAIAAGAVGYLLKDTLPDDLIRVIRDVHCGPAGDSAGDRRRARAARQSGDADLPRARRSSSCWRRGRETRRSRPRWGSAATPPARTSRASSRSSTCTTARPRWAKRCAAGSSTSASPPNQADVDPRPQREYWAP